MQALAFNSVSFDTISQNNQPWLRYLQIGDALEYKNPAHLNKIYQKHADEFTPSMTQLVKLTTAGGLQETRIFSLRGAHLLAMFARTPKAAEFRHWVLDMLDKETAPQAYTDPLEALRGGRWLMTFQNGNVVLNPVPHTALIMTAEEIPAFISETLNVPKKLLPSIISACAHRLDTLAH
jgi:hypothetical protein